MLLFKCSAEAMWQRVEKERTAKTVGEQFARYTRGGRSRLPSQGDEVSGAGAAGAGVEAQSV